MLFFPIRSSTLNIFLQQVKNSVHSDRHGYAGRLAALFASFEPNQNRPAHERLLIKDRSGMSNFHTQPRVGHMDVLWDERHFQEGERRTHGKLVSM